MIECPYTEFYASFLGGFSLSFGETELFDNVNPQLIRMRILLILLKAGNQGIYRRELLNLVRPDEQDQKKRLSNLHQQIYLLRQELERANFPEGKYIVSKGSKFYFTRDYQVTTDIGELDLLIEQLRTGHKGEAEDQELYETYCRLYKGELLPMLHGEEWVTTESAYYQKWFSYCLNGLCQILRQEGQYETLLNYCTTASQIHPYDEWQAVQIECLMALNRYKEAGQLYEQTNELFYQELGVSPIERIMVKYQDIGCQLYNTSRMMAEVKEELTEKGEIESAYCCGYPNFLDVYHIIIRMGERFQIKSLLMVCSMEEETEAAQNDIRTSQRMEQLEQIIAKGIRAGDVYTRYSPNQFLLLLIGTSAEDGAVIAWRLEQRWKQIMNGQDVLIHFDMYETEESQYEVYGNGKNRNIHCAYH